MDPIFRNILKHKWLLIFIGIILIITFLTVFSFLDETAKTMVPCISEYQISDTLVKDSTETFFGIETRGSDKIISDLQDIEKKPYVKGLLLVVSSPGGGVYPTKEIYYTLKNYSKPIVVYIEEVATSGGYYITLPAKHIVAHPDAIVGSIGVRIDHVTLAGLFEKLGINATSYKSGRYKDFLSSSRNVTKEDLKLIDAILLDTFEEFKSDVLKHRGNKITDPDVFEAKIYTGRQAYAVGLVDSIGRKEDAKKIAAEVANISERYTTCDFSQKKRGLGSLLSGFFESVGIYLARGFYSLIESQSQKTVPILEYS